MNALVRDRIITPSVVTGLQPYTGVELFGWWDPSDSLNVTKSGGRFDQVNDKSGNDNHLTSSGDDRPFDSRTINGLEVMDFKLSQNISTNSFPIESAPFTCFLIVKSDLDIGVSGMILGGNDVNNLIFYHRDSTDQFNLGLSLSGADNLTPNLFITKFDSPGYLKYGANFITGNVSNKGPVTSFILGQRSNKTLSFDGFIGEVIIYNSSLTDIQTNQTGQYLSDKYATSYTDIT